MCDQLIAHMSIGHSFESFGAIVKVSRQTLYKWEEKHKDFEAAKSIGYSCWCLYLEKIMLSKMTGVEIIKGIKPKDIEVVPALFFMKTLGGKVFYERKSEDKEDKPTVINLNYKV